MSKAPDPIVVGQARSHSGFNSCGCCEGMHARTPVEIYNRPGLTSLSYRIGTHQLFKESMVVGLSDAHLPALQDFTNREERDSFTIALFEAWATIADVLTFYQERIANESYLRTATEQRSLFEMARLIGYKPKPGVAANTFLAFTLEDAPGSPGKVTIEAGTKVQSVPGPGQKPQIFETGEKVGAQAEWNSMTPRLTEPQEISLTMSSITLQGANLNLKVGDSVLVIDASGNRAVRTILAVKADTGNHTTILDLTASAPPQLPNGKQHKLPRGTLGDLLQQNKLTDQIIQGIVGKTWSSEDLLAAAKSNSWPIDVLASKIAEAAPRGQAAPGSSVLVFRQRANIFGANAPKQLKWRKKPEKLWDWPLAPDDVGTSLFLDGAYPAILPGSYIAIEKPGKTVKILKVDQVTTFPRTAYGLSSRTTRLTFSNNASWRDGLISAKPKLAELRDITVHAQSEPIPLANSLIMESVEGDCVMLAKPFLGLGPGQTVILTGIRTDFEGVKESEVLTLKSVDIEGGFAVLLLNKPLEHSYLRGTVTINANAIRATHGETTSEILGGSDSLRSWEQFILAQKPLTFTHAAERGVAESSLRLRINDVLWHEVPSLLGAGSMDHVFTARTDTGGRTIVEFGDGKTGARLPVGVENVRAEYRKGIGCEGLVQANTLTQLMTRPLGVKGVSNPLQATDAEDPESLEDVRVNAPLSLLTFDRVVSFQDYEDFARGYPGIAKAKADVFGDGHTRAVLVTVAGLYDRPVSEAALSELTETFSKAGNPFLSVRVRDHRKALFRIIGHTSVNPDYEPTKVLEEVRERLRNNFSFNMRELGQPVALSEVIGVIQGVRGVVSVRITNFFRAATDTPAAEPRVAELLLAGTQTAERAAELLTLDESSLGGLDVEL